MLRLRDGEPVSGYDDDELRKGQLHRGILGRDALHRETFPRSLRWPQPSSPEHNAPKSTLAKEQIHRLRHQQRKNESARSFERAQAMKSRCGGGGGDVTYHHRQGALEEAGGFILSLLMSKAMNRSFANVLFGAFGSATTAAASAKTAEGLIAEEHTAEDAAVQLAFAKLVIVIPGYGLAVAQAQHQVRELTELIEKKGGEVRFAIHPVAGRMPGHMNVLLAEANFSYEKLIDMEEINGDFANADVALVIGANDVVNPAAPSPRWWPCRS